MVKDRYDPNKIRQELVFEKIKKKHDRFVMEFRSYQKDLEEFLVQDALKLQEISVSNTLLVFDAKDCRKKRNRHILGYITILNDGIILDKVLKDEFRSKGVNYSSLPALKIGRLCVDDKFQRRCIGRCILIWAMYRAAMLNQSCACRFVTLDAKRDEDISLDSLGFYLKHGFRELYAGKMMKDTSPMYIDVISTIRKSLGKV